MISVSASITDPANIGLVVILSVSIFMVHLLIRIINYGLRWNVQRRDTKIVSASTEEKNMMKLSIPFTFKLAESYMLEQQNNPSGLVAVPCVVSSSVPYTLRVWWGVSIRELHEFLWLPWNEVWKGVQTGKMLNVSFMHKGEDTHRNPHGNRLNFISSPQPAMDLGSTPRKLYPLVVIMVRICSVVNDPYTPMGLINVVHIKDPICTVPTNILAHYVKLRNGQLSCVKPIYKASLNLGNYSRALLMDSSKDQQRLEEHVCVACLHAPLSRALLPCRHACVCAMCFPQLNRCPMCRTSIASYFCIREEDYMKGP